MKVPKSAASLSSRAPATSLSPHYHDAIVSFYRFFEGCLFEPGTISLEALTHWP
jgi:hypothetical protein